MSSQHVVFIATTEATARPHCLLQCHGSKVVRLWKCSFRGVSLDMGQQQIRISSATPQG